MSEQQKFSIDLYDSVNIDCNDSCTADQFDKFLREMIPQWTTNGQHSVCVNMTLASADLVAVCARHQFTFHHALDGRLSMLCNATADRVMMIRWLAVDKPNTFPRYPFTTIGVGALVTSSDNMILLMRERRGVYLGWKFPGGLAEPGETLLQSAAREVSGSQFAIVCLLVSTVTGI